VARTPDQERRAALLDAAVDYVCAHGLADLSLRPLAKAVGSSPRVLLHYFNSKEELVVEIIRAGRVRQQAMLAKLKLSDRKPKAVAAALWRAWSAPQGHALTRLSFEVYALALQDRTRFGDFLKRSIEDWLSALERCAPHPNASAAEIRSFATMLIAGFRGFMLDLLASGDRKRVNDAFDRWLDVIYET
jgi:AcrR family transcriptional regulator